MIYCLLAPKIGYKIGFTAQPLAKRIASIQNGCPAKLLLMFAIKGGKAEERAIHRFLRPHRLRGEWYKMSAERIIIRIGIIENYMSVLDAHRKGEF